MFRFETFKLLFISSAFALKKISNLRFLLAEGVPVERFYSAVTCVTLMAPAGTYFKQLPLSLPQQSLVAMNITSVSRFFMTP